MDVLVQLSNAFVHPGGLLYAVPIIIERRFARIVPGMDRFRYEDNLERMGLFPWSRRGGWGEWGRMEWWNLIQYYERHKWDG